MNFGENLQKLRKEHHLSQEELAGKLNVSRQAVSKWESNFSYPEMDKIIAMSKIFNCSIDSLINEDTKNNVDKTTLKKNIEDYKNDVVYFLKKSIKMFSNMSLVEIIKLILVMLLVIGMLCVFKLPVDYIQSIGSKFFDIFPDLISNILINIWSVIIDLVYFIIAIIIFIYIYKVKFLDNFYEIKKSRDDKKLKNINEQTSNTEITNSQKILKKEDHSNSLLDFMAKIILYFVKFMAIVIAIPFVFTILILCAILIVSIILIFNKVVFLGVILGIIACISLNIVILEILFNFVFNIKLKAKRLFIQIIISLILLGVGIGITSIDIASFKYIDTAPNVKWEDKTFEYEMNNNLVLIDYYFNDSIKWVEDENISNIKINVKYAPMYSNFSIDEDDAILYIAPTSVQSISFNSIYELILKDLRNREFHNYNDLSHLIITISANKENITKLQENINTYYEQEEQDIYEDQINELYQHIDNLEEENNNLKDSNELLKEENEEIKAMYEEQLQEYQQKIDEYKNSVNSLN